MVLANILGHMEWALCLKNKERGIIICIIFRYPYRFIVVFELSQIKFVLIKTQEDVPKLFYCSIFLRLNFNSHFLLKTSCTVNRKKFKKLKKKLRYVFEPKFNMDQWINKTISILVYYYLVFSTTVWKLYC